MNTPMDDHGLRSRISPEDADRFLDRLASDDEFRSSVEQNPHGVLGAHGIEVATSKMPDPVKLPSKDHVRSVIDTANASGMFGEPDSTPRVHAIMMCVVGAIPFVASDLQR